MATDVNVLVQEEVSHVTVDNGDVEVLTITDEQQVVLEERYTHVVSVGEQGPAGAQGPIGPTGGSGLTVTAGAALGGHRVVHLDSAEKAQYASNAVAEHALITLGMTIGAATLNAPVDVLRSGDITEPSWNWTLGQPVYLADNGLITQTPPGAPALFQRIIGFPMTATKLYLSFRDPIFI